MTMDVYIGLFVWLLGLCVGSFLNVVVYRLPAGLSIHDPPRSFCPACRKPIAWYDNIPVLSWLLLKARCRRCAAPISVQYPLVEAVTGLTFTLIYYALYLGHARYGVESPAHPADWPLLLSWLVLAAALIACAAMDVVSYMVDVRVMYVAIGAGIALHGAWPRPEFFRQPAATPGTAAAAAVFLVSMLMLWLTVWRGADDEHGSAPAESPPATSESERHAVRLGGLVAIVVFVGLSIWFLLEVLVQGLSGRDGARLGLPPLMEVYHTLGSNRGIAADFVVPASLAAIFGATVLVGGQRRAADQEVHAAIEGERPQARQSVLRELGWLAAPVLAGVVIYLALSYWPAAGSAWQAAVKWSPGGGFCPVGGVAFAMHGAIVGAAAGWGLRIVFTLVFGREALGVGDIYILAAAGAAAGWDIALLGLLLAVGLAIGGFLLSLALKRSGIIAFGPWLAIGFVAALWLNRPAAGRAQYYFRELSDAWAVRPDICLAAGGVMLVGSVVAVVLARMAGKLMR